MIEMTPPASQFRSSIDDFLFALDHVKKIDAEAK
jgi:hypothetical protein